MGNKIFDSLTTKEKKWHYRFMKVAHEVAAWSLDPSSKVGAVAVNKKKQMYLEGFNGFPKRIKDLPERLNNREEKYKYILHAEQNLISNATANKVSLEGATVYVAGIPPCAKCALELIQADIHRIVVDQTDIERLLVENRDSWLQSWDFSKELFAEAEIEVVILD